MPDASWSQTFLDNVHELEMHLSSAKLARHQAICSAFRDLPPLRPLFDAARLGTDLPVITAEGWQNFLDTLATDHVREELRNLQVKLADFKDRITFVANERAELQQTIETRIAEWKNRRTMPTQGDFQAISISYVAHEHARDVRAEALETLEHSFGASSSSDDAMLPPALEAHDVEYFFRQSVRAEFDREHNVLLKHEALGREEWETTFAPELDALRKMQMGPSSTVPGMHVQDLPSPWISSHTKLLNLADRLLNEQLRIKKKLVSLAEGVQWHHANLRRLSLEEALREVAREYREMDHADNDDEDDAAIDARERREAFKTAWLDRIRDMYEDACVSFAIVHANSSRRLSHASQKAQTIIDGPFNAAAVERLRVLIDDAKEAHVSSTTALRNTLHKHGAQLVLNDAIANRCIEASWVLRTFRKTRGRPRLPDDLVHNFLSDIEWTMLNSPWRDHNHRGGVGFDEAMARMRHWIEYLVIYAFHVKIDTHSLFANRDLQSGGDDPNFDDHNRPFLPYVPRRAPLLPSLSEATRTAMDAFCRRALMLKVR
jgi:hypothetical protein